MNKTERILAKCPQLSALLEAKKKAGSEQPTDTQRIEALEAAVADMMLLQLQESEGTGNA